MRRRSPHIGRQRRTRTISTSLQRQRSSAASRYATRQKDGFHHLIQTRVQTPAHAGPLYCVPRPSLDPNSDCSCRALRLTCCASWIILILTPHCLAPGRMGTTLAAFGAAVGGVSSSEAQHRTGLDTPPTRRAGVQWHELRLTYLHPHAREIVSVPRPMPRTPFFFANPEPL